MPNEYNHSGPTEFAPLESVPTPQVGTEASSVRATRFDKLLGRLGEVLLAEGVTQEALGKDDVEARANARTAKRVTPGAGVTAMRFTRRDDHEEQDGEVD